MKLWFLLILTSGKWHSDNTVTVDPGKYLDVCECICMTQQEHDIYTAKTPQVINELWNSDFCSF